MSQKVTLKKLKLEHAQIIFDLTERNREYLREWLPWLDQVQTIADTIDFINCFNESNSPPHYVILFDGDVCGVAGFYEINVSHKVGSIGYWLSENYTGKGIATLAVKNLIEIGFKEQLLNKIEIRCAEGNYKSRAIPEKLGFMYEATLRECEWLYTKYVNHAVYSLLSSEFKA